MIKLNTISNDPDAAPAQHVRAVEKLDSLEDNIRCRSEIERRDLWKQRPVDYMKSLNIDPDEVILTANFVLVFTTVSMERLST